MMHTGFTGAIVTASLKPSAGPVTPTTLILRQASGVYVPQTGDTLVLQFQSGTYVPPASL
jgi:hypothetical protein